MNRSHEIHESSHSDPRAVFRTAREREEEIERSAAYTGRLIREADSDARFELTEAASAILREEALGETTQASTARGVDARVRSVNPLSAGIGIVVLGAGISLLLPMVGIAMMIIGAIALLWGLAISIRGR